MGVVAAKEFFYCEILMTEKCVIWKVQVATV